MRFAYEIKDITANIATIVLFNAAECAENPACDKVVMRWARNDNKSWSFLGISIHDVNGVVNRLLRGIKPVLKDKDSPLKVVLSLAQETARQVVYDERMKKYRNVTTMKEGEDTFAAVGVKNIVTTAENEEKAIARIKKTITSTMMENPASAAELAGWFTAGCKVSKLASGKLPDVVGREALAGPGEHELAKKPVVVRPKTKKIKKKDA